MGKVVLGLLGATGRLTQTELTDLADVSARSIRDNRELLEAVSLLDVDEDGYRLTLSFADERQTDVLPGLVTSSVTSTSDVAYELLILTLEDVDRLADPDDPVGECFYWPPDMATLCDRTEDIAPWIRLAANLLGEELEEPEPVIATLGPSIEQAALADLDVGSGKVAAD